MKLTDDDLRTISKFIDQPNKKVLLIVGDEAGHDVVSFINNKTKQTGLSVIFLNVSEQSNINTVLQSVPVTQPAIFIFNHSKLVNYYNKYALSRWQAKVIVLCEKSLLHSTLDASIYFAPLKNGRIQRQLFSRLILRNASASFQEQPTKPISDAKHVSLIEKQPSVDMHQHFLNQRLLANDIAMMQMLAGRVLINPVLQAFLFQMVLASRDDESLCLAAANAITALNTACVSFAGLDLSGIRIPDANLRNAIFHYTNLSRADLSRVDLRQTYLCHANLSNAQMRNIKYGELPYANLGGNHFLTVHLLCVSNNGRYLAVALGVAVMLFDLVTGTEQFLPERNAQPLMSIQFSSDSKLLISSSYDSIQLWDVKTRESIGAVLRNENASFNCAAFSYDGTRFASGDINGVICLWETNTQKMIGEPLLRHAGTICSLAFSPNNKFFASGGMDKTIQIWDLKTQQCVVQPLIGHASGILSLAFHPKNHSLLASGGQDGKICFWDVAREIQLSQSLAGHTSSINSLSFSPGGNLLASGSDDRSVRLWDVESKLALSRPFLGHQDRVNAVAFSSDGKVLFSVGCSDQTIRRWVIEDAPQQNSITAIHNNIISSIAFSPDSKFIATGSWDKSVQLLSLKMRQPINSRLIGTAFLGIRSVIFSSNANILITVGEVINIWSAFNYPYYKYTTELSYFSHGAQTAALSPNNKLLVSGGFDKMIRLWDCETYQPLEPPFVGHNDQVTTVTFSKNGLLMASGSSDSTVRLWNVSNRQLIKVWMVTTVYSPDGNPIIPKFNSPETPKYLVNSIAFSPNDELLAAGCSDSMIWLWKVDGSTQYHQKLMGHTKPVICICFHPQSELLASGSMDYTVRLWQISTLQCVAIYPSLESVRSVCFSSDGNYLCASNGSDIILWQRGFLAADHNQYLLQWYTGAANLNVQQLNLQSARGLAQQDVRLLTQLGAVKAEVDSDTARDAAETKIVDCNLALKSYPDDAVLYYIRANAKYALGQYDEALKDFDAAIALNSFNADYFNNRASCRASLYRYAEALSDYDLAIIINPNNAMFYESRGNIHYLLKQYDQAHQEYDQAFALERSIVYPFKKAIICLFQNNVLYASLYCNQILMMSGADEVIPRLQLYARITLNFTQWLENNSHTFVANLMDELYPLLTTPARKLTILCEYIIKFYLHVVEQKWRHVEFQPKLRAAYKELLIAVEQVLRDCPNEPIFFFYYGRLLLIGNEQLKARQAFVTCCMLAPGFFAIADWINKCDTAQQSRIFTTTLSHQQIGINSYISNNLDGYKRYGLLSSPQELSEAMRQNKGAPSSSQQRSFK